MRDTPSFGQWLSQRRKALDLTQEALAERMSCSGSMIRKLEAGQRVASQEIAELLAALLEVVPDERAAFVQFAKGRLSGDAAKRKLWLTLRSHTAQTHPTNLATPLTALIGREQELESLRKLILLENKRLLTLIGPPGIGKTRLSLEVGIELLDHFEDGVFFVGLASTVDPNLVLTAIAQALGVPDKSAGSLLGDLQQSLGSKQMLLLLDNFEQVLDASPLVLELLGACPHVKVLATSREALHVYGEQQFPVPALATPDPENLPPIETMRGVPAVVLFTERARAVKPDFVLTEENAGAVAAICTRLEGLPLAIELAAARIKLLSPQEMQSRLDSSLSILTGGPRNVPARQQTLRAAIEWSYNLLNNGEQRLFARLVVFVGGCTLPAIEAICNAEYDLGINVLDGIDSLVSKSLLRQEEQEAGESRFTMLEMIREYAVERLGASREDEVMRRLHAEYYLALAEAAEQEMLGTKQEAWMDRLEQEHDNIRSALRWLLNTGNSNLALRLGGALWAFWSKRGHVGEGRTWVRQALALARDRGDAKPLSLAGALVCAGKLARSQGDYSEALALNQEALDLYRQEGDRKGECAALNNLAAAEHGLGNNEAARLLHEQNLPLRRALGDTAGVASTLNNLALLVVEEDPGQARVLLEESLALNRELGNLGGAADSIYNLAIALRAQNQLIEARFRFEESLALFRQLKDKEGIQMALMQLGMLAFDNSDMSAARQYFSQSLKYCLEVNDRVVSVWNLEGLATLAAAEGLHEQAARLMGASEGLSEAIGVPISTYSPHHERILTETKSLLDEQVFQWAWAEGRRMTLEQAIEYALGESSVGSGESNQHL